ncbi:MAG: hypothetical protein ACNA7V_04410 [Bacteroidales bacterium]
MKSRLQYTIDHLPSFSIGVILLSIIYINFNEKRWKDPERVIVNDVISYYSYLPAVFIHHDLLFNFIDHDFDFYIHKYRLNQFQRGARVIQTSMGLALLYSPFFLAAHFSAPLLGYGQDGFTEPYRFALIFSSMIYLLIGLVFLKKVLIRYFNPVVTAITILAVVMGTNLLHYSTYEGPMSHTYNFSLIAIFLYLIIRWFENPTIKLTVFTGFIAGLITLIRPTNILVLVIFVLWDVKSRTEFKERILYFLKQYRLILIIAGFFILVWLPQFLYWKYTTGSFLYYSYGTFGERFFFNSPKVIDQLFSYRKGWFLYTPVMFFGFIGIAFLYRKQYRSFFVPVLGFMLLMIYVLSSWWSWWFGGSFGLRSYIDTYAVMAIPIAVMIDAGFRYRRWTMTITSVLILLLVSLNLFQTWQYHKGYIHFSGMTKKAYWSIFGKTSADHDYWYLIEIPDHTQAVKGIYTTFPKDPYLKLTEDNCVEVTISKIRNNEDWLKLVEEKAILRGLPLDTMIQIDAAWNCKKMINQGLIEKTPEHLRKCIAEIIEQMKNDEGWMSQVEEKARKKKITTEEMMREDAEWICKNSSVNE